MWFAQMANFLVEFRSCDKLWFDHDLLSCDIQMQIAQQTMVDWLAVNWDAKLGFVFRWLLMVCINCILLWHLNSQNLTNWIVPPLGTAADGAMQEYTHLVQN